MATAITAYYFSTSHGKTSTDEVWEASVPSAYLKSVSCTYDAKEPWFQWETELSAEQLLENTNLSISAVSVQSGFSSVKTFHRVFHEQYGVTPGQSRDQIRAVLQPGVIGT